jgi:redox-sensitive bicupin YhaK (pirin superfamily)
MITLRRAAERHYDRRHKQEVWLTFYPRDRADPRADHFGPLKSLSERRLPPGAIASQTPHHDAEIVTYVRAGALAYEDAPGRSGVIQAGEFQGTTAGRGIRRSEKNASRSNWAQVFQLLLAPGAAFAAARRMRRDPTGRKSSSSCWLRRSRGSRRAMSRSASVRRSAAGAYASSARPTRGEDRCASIRTL